MPDESRELTPSLLVKLASLVAHVQELDLSNPASVRFDLGAAIAVVADPEIVEWMTTIDPVLLPERR